MEERVSLIRWIKENKKELMYAGLSVAALILLVLGIKHRDAIKAVWESLTNALKGPPVSTTNQAPVRMADIAKILWFWLLWYFWYFTRANTGGNEHGLQFRLLSLRSTWSYTQSPKWLACLTRKASGSPGE